MGKAPLELGTRGDSLVTAVACHPVEEIVAIGYSDGMILVGRFGDQKEVLLASPRQRCRFVDELGHDRTSSCFRD